MLIGSTLVSLASLCRLCQDDENRKKTAALICDLKQTRLTAQAMDMKEKERENVSCVYMLEPPSKSLNSLPIASDRLSNEKKTTTKISSAVLFSVNVN